MNLGQRNEPSGEAKQPLEGFPQSSRSPKFARRIVHYAQITLITLLLSGFGLLAFAGIAILRGPKLGPEAALETAQQLVRKLNQDNQPVRLQHFEAGNQYYKIHIRRTVDGSTYMVRMNQAGELQEITEEHL
jgi:hypothetical protein